MKIRIGDKGQTELTCYSRLGSATNSNGAMETCSSSDAACYSYVTPTGLQYAGCTSSSSYRTTVASKSRFMCRTNYCNSVTSSVISCYTRTSRSSPGHGSGAPTTCPNGVYSCYTFVETDEAGCGTCGSSPKCTSCNTDLCNKLPVALITCYSRVNLPPSSVSNGVELTCSTSSNSVCIAYTDENAVHFAGCSPNGCNSISYKSCISCTTDRCNGLASSSLACYTRSSDSYSTNGVQTNCPVGTTSCYASTSDGEAGCGTCGSSPSCKSCNSNYCNVHPEQHITCYYRSGVTAKSNGGTITCSARKSVCYSIIDNYGNHYAGCGQTSCHSHNFCNTCHDDYCNNLTSSSISCFTRDASVRYSNGTATFCPAGVTSCYAYSPVNTASWHSGDTAQAGCGDCRTSSDACTTCKSSYCNAFGFARTEPKKNVHYYPPLKTSVKVYASRKLIAVVTAVSLFAATCAVF